MFMMTARIDKKKLWLILAGIAALIAVLVFWSTHNNNASGKDTEVSVNTNEDRVKYLSERGIEVAASPVESQQVKIPDNLTEVLERYNALQRSQGFDLADYTGKVVTRYVYQVHSDSDAAEPVYASILVYRGKVIGGDIVDTSVGGSVRGLHTPDYTTEIAP